MSTAISDMGTDISSLTGGTMPRSTVSAVPSSHSRGGNPNNRTKKKPWGKQPVAASTATFEGVSPELSNKVFVTGHQQASKYDGAYKALL